MTDENEELTTYLERGIKADEVDAFYAIYDGPIDAARTLGDAIHEESRKLLAVTNPYPIEGRIRVLVVPHGEEMLADALELLPRTVEVTRTKPGVYEGTEPPQETLTWALYAIRPTETRVTYDEALKR